MITGPNQQPRKQRTSGRLRNGSLAGLCAWLIASYAGMAAHPDYVEGEAIVVFKNSSTVASARQTTARHSMELAKHFDWLSEKRNRVHGLVRSKAKSTVDLIAELKADPEVEYAEPNYLRHVSVAVASTPNDTSFTNLWGLNNTGQTIAGSYGTSGDDIRFLNAWGMAKPSTSEVVVAVIDTGLDTTHPDISSNLWTNPGNISADTYTGDTHGYDFVDGKGDVSDSGDHGTHVCGTIAASGNNATGVIGVAYKAHIMMLKVSNDGSSIDSASEIEAINYAAMMKSHGVNVVAINASFGGGSSSTTESTAIQAAGTAGIVFCVAAGNSSENNDTTSTYPASYRLSNMIVVAASDQSNALANFSNYGLTTVDLAAPGVNIYSLVPSALATSASSIIMGTTSYPNVPLTYSGTTSIKGITAKLYNCGIGNTGQFPAGVSGNIALIQRGTLTFASKVTNAMNAGAKAAVIYNNVAYTPGNTTGTNSDGTFNGTLNGTGAWIPALSISQANGTALVAASPVTVTLKIPASYQFMDGTSMATPHVTGAVAFAAMNFPTETATQRVARIVNNTTAVSAFSTKLRHGLLNLAKIVDTDSNGLPDWWETQYFGAIGQSPSADPYGNGFTLSQDFALGYNPKNSYRLFIYQTAVVPNGANKDFRIGFPTVSGWTYRVERSDTLAAASWVQVGSNVTGTGGTTQVTDPSAVTLHPKRFYRVRIITSP
jgi:subtilisin family serine protease